MFQQLQDYFFQYRHVVIPGVGGFKAEQQPAALDVVNQVLLPPAFQVRFQPAQPLPPHQMQVLSAAYDNNTELAAAELERFAAALRSSLAHEPFQWSGVGTLDLAGEQVRFVPQVQDSWLLPVPAHRVLREHVQHTVLVGDQELQYNTEAYAAAFPEAPARSLVAAIGWIVAGLALLFLAYQLYSTRFDPAGAGLQTRPAIEAAPAQYR